MNLVRLGMIAGLCGIAYYAMTIYAGLPTIEPVVQKVTAECVVKNDQNGLGMVFVALLAVAGAISVSAVDLYRRVY